MALRHGRGVEALAVVTDPEQQPVTAPVEGSVGENRIGGGSRLSIVHANVSVSPSGSLEPAPFSVTIA